MSKKNQKAICIFGSQCILEQLQAIENEIDGALQGQDIEHVHRMRVASRRLRNTLDLFKDCLPPKKAKKWRDTIRRITHALGNARDTDVQIVLINNLYENDLDARYKPGYRRLLLRLKQRRVKYQAKIKKVFKKLSKKESLPKMKAYFKAYAEKSQNTYLYTPALYQKAFDAVSSRLDVFLDLQAHLETPENAKKLHALRIAGKNLRYTLEIFAPLYQDALTPTIDIMKQIQDSLGEIHDDDVWINWLPKFIKKEKERIEDYFGNTGPLKRLMPGLEHLMENRQIDRDEKITSFLITWQEIHKNDSWTSLKKIISAPFDVMNAMDKITEEDNAAEKTETSEEKTEETPKNNNSSSDPTTTTNSTENMP
jgi:CHAD domain-containing protein